MNRYRKKPVEVHAFKWEGQDEPKGITITLPTAEIQPGEPLVTVLCIQCGSAEPHGELDTRQGPVTVCPGDWIIFTDAGEHYPCKPDVFEATYEPA